MSELEKAFQVIGAYNGLCVPYNTSKEAYMTSIINLDEPYKTVVMNTAKRMYTDIMEHQFLAGEMTSYNSGLIDAVDVMFMQMHCKCQSLEDLHKFIS